MVLCAASAPPSFAWAESTAQAAPSELVVVQQPAQIATSPAPAPTAPPSNAIAMAPRPTAPWSPDPGPTEPHFYGWQNIVVGHASLTATVLIAVLADGAGGSEAGGVVGLGYVLGSPIVHAVHDGGVKSFVALGMLVGIPATLALGGLVVDEACGGGSSCDGSTWAYGMLAGLVIAPIVDGVALGWGDVPADPPRADERASFTVTPVVNASLEPGKESLHLGVGGTF